MPFPPRDSQTRIKHGILREYVGAWAGIISTGLRGIAQAAQARGRPFLLSFVYVDGFGGAGRYERDSDQPSATGPVWGSPIIGMKALEAAVGGLGVPVQVSGIVVEENGSNFAELVSNIQEAGLRTPASVRSNVKNATLGEITLVQGDFRQHVADIVHWLGDRFTLVFVDPYGTGMPLESLRPLLRRPRTDAIVLFPFLDIDRKGGSARKPESERTPNDRGNITRVTNVFGSQEWMRIAQNSNLLTEEREELYTALYAHKLRDIDPELGVKSIPLRLSAMDRTGYHLFLTTRDPDGALRMNAILRGAEFKEHFAVWADYQERRRRTEEEQGLLALPLDLSPVIPPTAERDAVTTEDVAQAVLALCAPGEYELKWLYGRMANEPFTADEIKKALRRLKQDGRVRFQGPLQKKDEKIQVIG